MVISTHRERVIDDVIENTLRFLRAFGRLGDSDARPVFEAPYQIQRPINGGVVHQPWRYGDPLFFVQGVGDEVQGSFERATAPLERIRVRDLELRINQAIPDSSEFALVDIGSSAGKAFTNEFSRNHPSVRVVMVDCMGQEALRDELVYGTFENEYTRCVGFERRVPVTDDVERTMNALLDANGLRNARYVHRELALRDGSGLTDVLADVRGRRIIFTGFRAPRQLGYITLDEMRLSGGVAACVSMSRLEQLRLDDAAFQRFARIALHYGLREEEIAKYHSLLFDPHSPRLKEKYDEKDEGERRFGVMLKQLFVAASAQWMKQEGYGTRVALLLPNVPHCKTMYNQPDHVVYVHKGEGLLRI